MAEAVGVSESSIKRWVDDGRIRAHRTAGGHRRIAASEALRFVRETGSVLVRPEALGLTDLLPEVAEPASEEAVVETLHERLQAGAADEVRSLLVSLFVQGWSVAQIVDGPLRGAMERIGELWRDQPPGVYLEHRATDIAIQAVSRLRLLQEPAPEAPCAVGGAPAGDPYILPTLCVAAVLESQGIAAVNLGPQTPIQSLRLAIEDLDVRMAWLSVSVVENPERLRRQLTGLVPELRARGVPLVVGGSRARRLKLPADEMLYVGSSMAELEALVLGLRLGAAAELG